MHRTKMEVQPNDLTAGAGMEYGAPYGIWHVVAKFGMLTDRERIHQT